MATQCVFLFNHSHEICYDFYLQHIWCITNISSTYSQIDWLFNNRKMFFFSLKKTFENSLIDWIYSFITHEHWLNIFVGKMNPFEKWKRKWNKQDPPLILISKFIFNWMKIHFTIRRREIFRLFHSLKWNIAI